MRGDAFAGKHLPVEPRISQAAGLGANRPSVFILQCCLPTKGTLPAILKSAAREPPSVFHGTLELAMYAHTTSTRWCSDLPLLILAA